MDLAGWDERYRAEADLKTARLPAATPLLVDGAASLPPGRALDLACGTGRNALWLAERGWIVTAVDGSPVAIDILRDRARRLGVAVDARLSDFEKAEFAIEPACWNLIAMCYYLERALFGPSKVGLVPGGLFVAIALLIEPGHTNSPFRLERGELRHHFEDWEILHYREGRDQWRHAVAEIVVRKPMLILDP